MRRTLTVFGCTALLGVGLCIAGPAGAATPSNEPRIVGGSVANVSQWPFMAALYFDGEQGCGGTVIAPTAVLTAAHCVQGTYPEELSVGTGRRVLSDSGSGQTIGVADYYVHPGYRRTGRTDFAVLRLDRPTSAPAAQLSSAPTDGPLTAPGSALRVAGWGATTPAGYDPGSDALLETVEGSLAPRRCRWAYGRDFTKHDQICTLGPRLGFGQNASSCFGDSGGPLVADGPAGRQLVGVVSFGGNRCGNPRYPSVYARVAPQVGWIMAAAAR
jgi:trypsin